MKRTYEIPQERKVFVYLHTIASGIGALIFPTRRPSQCFHTHLLFEALVLPNRLLLSPAAEPRHNKACS